YTGVSPIWRSPVNNSGLFFVRLLLLIPYAALCCGGNSAIEWCLVPVAIGLYHIYQSFSCGFTNLRIIKIGLCCGICLMIHPYGVAPLLGAAVYCFFAHHNYKKRIIGLLFLVAPTVLFIVYFAAYGCLFDFLHAVWTIPIKELCNSVTEPTEMLHKAIKCLLFAPLFFCGIRNLRKHDKSYGLVQISIAIISGIILLCCNNGWHFFLAAIPALLLAMGEIASSRQIWIGVTIAFYCFLCSIPLRDYVTFLSEGTLDVVWEWYEDLLIFQADDSDFHMTIIDTDSSYLLEINEKPSYRYFCDQTTIMENISTAVSEWEAYMASLGEEDIVVTSDHTWQGREIDNFSQVQVYLKTECISVYIYTGAEI
ncbi:MAG: hypothetical protein LUD14_03455, partial [Clostridiales bacterium]|nr:hypothetical protein [Clostridiales bacterium]